MFFIMRRIASLSQRVKILRSNIPQHEYSTYLDNANIKKRRGHSEYHNFDELCVLKQSANNAVNDTVFNNAKDEFERKIRWTDAYANVARTHRTFVGKLKGYIPFTDAHQAKLKLNEELDNVTFFLKTFESDFYARKRQEKAIFNRVNHLFGEKAVTMMRSSLIKAEQIQNFLNNKDTPFDYLGSERIKNSPNYHAFITLAYSINENKSKLIKQAKPTLLSPTKFSYRAQIDNIFPAGSVYRNYIDQTNTWKGYIKSFIPFTKEYRAKEAVAIELKKVKLFIKAADKEFSRNSIALLAVKYPKIKPQIANASLSQPISNVTVAISSSPPIEPIKHSPTQDTVASSDARVLLRTSNDALRKSDPDRISPRTLERELEEDKQLAEKFDNEARARAEILTLPTDSLHSISDFNNKDILSGKVEKNNNAIGLLVKYEEGISDTSNRGKRPGLATF